MAILGNAKARGSVSVPGTLVFAVTALVLVALGVVVKLVL